MSNWKRVLMLILMTLPLIGVCALSLSETLPDQAMPEEIMGASDEHLSPVDPAETTVPGLKDLLPAVDSRSLKGLTYTALGKGYFEVSGTEESFVNFDLFTSKTSLPEGVLPGHSYYLNFTTDDIRFRARVYCYDEQGNVKRLVSTITSTAFTLPENTVGIIVRVYSYAVRECQGANFWIAMYDMDEYRSKVALSLNGASEALSFGGMVVPAPAEDLLPETEGRILHGLTFTKLDKGHFVVNGSESSFVNFDLYSNKGNLPDGVAAGGKYFLRYFTDNRVFAARVYWYDTQGNETRLLETTNSIEFALPEEAVGMVIRIYCWNVVDCRNVHFEVALFDLAKDCTEAKTYRWLPRPMLTIIDDDGRVGFMTDLLPIIEELNSPITSANTTMRTELREATERYLQAKKDYQEGKISKKELDSTKKEFDRIRKFLGVTSESEDFGLRYMSWNEIVLCQARGAEIVSHTYAHRIADGNGSIPKTQIQYEYQLSKNALAAHGIYSETVVYNNGAGWNGTVREAAAKVFKFGIDCPSQDLNSGIPGHDVNYVTGDPHRIIRYNAMTDFDGMNGEKMKAFLYSLATGKTGWAVWMIHTSDPAWNHEKAEIIRDCIVYAQEIGLPVVTVWYGTTEYFDTSYPQLGIYR